VKDRAQKCPLKNPEGVKKQGKHNFRGGGIQVPGTGETQRKGGGLRGGPQKDKVATKRLAWGKTKDAK